MSFLPILDKAIDKIFPDKDEANKHKLKMRELENDGEFHELDNAMNMIIAEAKSNDPWTSRARPSFLYVMYIYLLMAIPVGLLAVIWPTQVTAAIVAAKAYLEAIPTQMWTLFGAGYLGYVKKRSDDKEVAAGKEPKKFLGLF